MEMSEITLQTGDPTRLAQVRQVDALAAIGVKIIRACRDVGIPRQTYYSIKERLAKDKGRSPAKDTDPNDHTPPNGASSPLSEEAYPGPRPNPKGG